MQFLRLFLAFIQKLRLISFHFPKINKRGVGIRVGGLENFSKINKRGGRLFGTREYSEIRDYLSYVLFCLLMALLLLLFPKDRKRQSPLRSLLHIFKRMKKIQNEY